MKKLFIAACAAMTGMMVLSGCGAEKQEAQQAEIADSGIQEAVVETPDLEVPEEENKGREKKGAAKELNLYTWDGMFPQEVLDGFEEETGIRIYYSNFDYDEDMLAKLEETQGGDYDVVIADDYIIELAIQEGLVQPLDKVSMENFDQINPLFQGQFYDKEDNYTVPYGAGIPLIIYNPALVDFEIKGYEDLWNPALKDNVAIIGNYRVIDGIALKTIGASFNTEDLDTIRKAGDQLLKLAQNIRLISDSNTQDYIISEEVAAAFLYTSQINEALKNRDDLKVVFPKEGLGFGIMAGFIPAKAPNPDAAHAFLDYILRPEVAAKCIEYIGYYCTNKGAEEFIPEDLKERLVVPDSVTEGEIVQNISLEAEDLHNEIWTKFKNACE